MKNTLAPLFAAVLLSLATASQAVAWGGFHSGYTYHSPGGGFYHSGSTAAYGPYGAHTASRSYGYNPSSGFYHSGYGQTSGLGGSAYHYSAGSDGRGATYGGYNTASGSYGRYAGAYRRW